MACLQVYRELLLKRGILPLLRRSSVFIINFDHISHLVLVFLLLTLRR